MRPRLRRAPLEALKLQVPSLVAQALGRVHRAAQAAEPDQVTRLEDPDRGGLVAAGFRFLVVRVLFVSVSGFSQWPGLFEQRFPGFFDLDRIGKRSSSRW